MKKKFKYLIILFMITSLGYCQNDYTELSESTYNTIKFHDVLFAAIKATNGDSSQMGNLFPVDEDNAGNIDPAHPNDVTIDEFGHEIGEVQKSFKYNSGLEIYFSNDDEDSILDLVAVVANEITIDGTELNIGDPISNLANVNYIISTMPKGYKFIEIVRTGLFSTPITISLNASDQITKIEYYINP